MEETALSTLTHWANFYVITGSAAAALTGLQFIVIVLNAQMNRGNEAGISAFATPTIVHFSTVLLTAALLTAPWLSAAPIAFILGLCGIAGLVYAALILQTALGQRSYTPVLEDWVCHFILPPLAYATLLIAALLLLQHALVALFAVAGTVLLLLFVGIHNAWDAVTFSAIPPTSNAGKKVWLKIRNSLIEGLRPMLYS